MSDEKILMPKHLTAENGGDMSLQERVKEIIHRWKFTCTIPNEDFYEVINIVREHDKHEHASFALECSEQGRADERERCVKAIELLDRSDEKVLGKHTKNFNRGVNVGLKIAIEAIRKSE